MTASWYDDHRNLAVVAQYMSDRWGDTVTDVVYMLEKPWKFEDAWQAVSACPCAAHRDETADCTCDCPLHMHVGDISDDGWASR